MKDRGFSPQKPAYQFIIRLSKTKSILTIPTEVMAVTALMMVGMRLNFPAWKKTKNVFSNLTNRD